MENKFGQLSVLNLNAVFSKGKTILKDISFTAPFKVMHPFYEREDIMTVMPLIASAGIMAGDRQRIDIKVSENAKMEFLSQSYDKVHRMEEGYALRETFVALEQNAEFYYRPLPVIPFKNSDFRNYLRVNISDETSRFVMTEVLTCGRLAYNEAFLYNRFQNKIEIYESDKLTYRDNTIFIPKEMDMTGFGFYEGFTHLLTILICNDKKDDYWLFDIRKLIDESADIEGGATLTGAGYILIKILGKNSQSLLNTASLILEK